MSIKLNYIILAELSNYKMALVRFINNSKSIALFNTMISSSSSASTTISQIGRWSIPASYKYQENAALISDRANADNCCGNGCNGCGASDIHFHNVTLNSKTQVLADGISIFPENERYYFPFTI